MKKIKNFLSFIFLMLVGLSMLFAYGYFFVIKKISKDAILWQLLKIDFVNTFGVFIWIGVIFIILESLIINLINGDNEISETKMKFLYYWTIALLIFALVLAMIFTLNAQQFGLATTVIAFIALFNSVFKFKFETFEQKINNWIDQDKRKK